MRILKKKGNDMMDLNETQQGMYDIQLNCKIPIGTEPKGDFMAIIPLSNGRLQISIHKAGIPLALGMLADTLSALAQMQYAENQRNKQEESRIVRPSGIVPNLTTH